jgi:hypothetical protein
VTRLIIALFCLALTFVDARAREPVDLELVLAVDVSFSMDPEEQRLQREGYVEALRDPEVLQAIANGIHGKIGITYIEWAGAGRVRTLVPWMAISNRATAEAFIDRLSREPYSRLSRTSISTGLIASMEAFKESPFEPMRRVIDVSGDGPNNDGPRVVPVRDAIVEQGVVINGLPILLNRQLTGRGNWGDIPNLDEYYEDCVIGGPGSFSIPIRERHEFVPATRRKILMEIANLVPEREPRVMRASTAPRVSCEIGEQMFRRWTDR